jgi:hypothetical protein
MLHVIGEEALVTLRLAGACLLASLSLLAGCDAFFGVNILKGLDKVSAPNPSQYDYATAGEAGLKKLQADLGSQAVVNALAADPAATAAIVGNLQATYSDPSVPLSDRQLAASLSGDVNLKTTSGSAVVNNAIQIATAGTGSQTVKDILQQIVPANVASDHTAFSATVYAFLNACAAYAVLGGTVPPAPPGINMGDVAQKAAVAWTVQYLVTQIGGTTQNAVDQMFNLLNNQPFSGPGTIDPFASGTAPAWLQNIFSAAGAAMPS